MAYLSLKAITAIIYINMVKHIVQQKEEQTPFEEREVQPFDFSDTELTTRNHVDSGLEEESWANEKEGDVERIDEFVNDSGTARMPYNHQDNDYSLCYWKIIIVDVSHD